MTEATDIGRVFDGSGIWDRDTRRSITTTGERILAWANRAFWVLLFAQALSIWTFTYFPSQDGPLHLYNAVMFQHYWQANYEPIRRFFEPSMAPVPNWICPHVLPWLVAVMRPELAEKTLLSLYLIGFPLAGYYALSAVRPRAGVLAIMLIPMTPNFYFHMGFQDFCLSMAGYFVVLGYWMRHRRNFAPRHALVLAVLLLALYFTHIVGEILVWVALGVTALGVDLTTGSPHSHGLRERLRPSHFRRTILIALAILPCLVLTLFFLSNRAGPHLTFTPRPWYHRFVYPITWLRAYHAYEFAFAAVVLALFAAVTLGLLFRRRSRILVARGGMWLALAAVYALIFLLAPDTVGGGTLLVVRLVPFPLFALLLWWAEQPLGARHFQMLAGIVAATSSALVVAMLLSHLISYSRINTYLKEYDQASAAIPWGATVLPIHWEDDAGYTTGGTRLSSAVDPFRHASARPLAERGAVDIQDEWASTAYHELRFRSALNPYYFAQGKGIDMDVIHFSDYTARTGQSINYVILWTGGTTHQLPLDRAIYSQMKGHYRLCFTSVPNGYVQVYERLADSPLQAASHDSTMSFIN